MEAYIEKLDKLIDAKKTKGHKISKKESEEYLTAWLTLVQDEGGFTSIAEKYFYDGFVFLSAKPLVKWMLGTEDIFTSFDAFFKGTLFGKDSNTTFRILMSVLANLLMTDFNDKNLVNRVIISIPLQSKNKEKKTFGDAHKIMLRYFVDELDSSVNFPALSDLNVKPVFITEFVELMDELIEKLKAADLSEIQRTTLEEIFKWIHPEIINIVKAEKKDKINSNVIITQIPQIDGEQEKEINSSEDELSTDPYERLGSLLNQAHFMIAKIRNLNLYAEKKAKVTSAVLQSEVDMLKSQRDDLQKYIISLEAQLNDRNNRIEVMNVYIRELEQSNEHLKAENNAQKIEIANRIQMMEALSRDRSKQSDEQLNRLISKLKVEYRDFKDAEGLDMSVDLGENMRDQLKNIFEIILKANISLD